MFGRIKYEIFYGMGPDVRRLLNKRIVSSVSIGSWTIVARHGVNKTTLRKILKNR